MSENKTARTSADGPVGWGCQPVTWGCQCGRAYTVACVSSKPPKQWVGLTDEEIYEYADKYLYQHGSNYGIKSFGKAIEAKLKEKNHG